MVDSELATSTKTSASKQNLSIQLSSSDVTSVPGLRSVRAITLHQTTHNVLFFIANLRSGDLASFFVSAVTTHDISRAALPKPLVL